MQLYRTVIGSVGGVLAATAAGWWYFNNARTETSTPQPPTLVIVEPGCFDFGSVAQERGRVESTFRLRNCSNHEATLSLAGLSCGCAEINLPERIKSGESVDVRVSLNPLHKSGLVQGVASIIPDIAGQRQTIKLSFRADVIPKHVLDEELIEIHDVGEANTIERSIVLVTRLEPNEQPAPPSIPTISSRNVGARHESREIDDRPTDVLRRVSDRYSLVIDVAAMPRGTFGELENVIISWPVRDAKPAIANVMLRRPYHPVVVGPTSVQIQNGRELSRSTVRLWRRDGKGLTIARIESCSKAIDALASDGSVGSVVSFDVFGTEQAPSDIKDACITVHFSEPDVPPYMLKVIN